MLSEQIWMRTLFSSQVHGQTRLSDHESRQESLNECMELLSPFIVIFNMLKLVYESARESMRVLS